MVRLQEFWRRGFGGLGFRAAWELRGQLLMALAGGVVKLEEWKVGDGIPIVGKAVKPSTLKPAMREPPWLRTLNALNPIP